MRMIRRKDAEALLRSEGGFTMLVAIGVLFVTGLLLTATFAVAFSEIHTTRRNTQETQAYYAAVAGVQEYQLELQINPDFWETCEPVKSTIPHEKTETYEGSYEVTVLAATTAPTGTTACQAANPFQTAIQSSGELANTFSVESKGTSGPASKTVIATFKATGFLDFLYFTNFETEDPSLYSNGSECAGKYYSEWSKAGNKCNTITFASADDVNGPMHTNDAARLEGSVTFGRKGENPADTVEMYGGAYPEDEKYKCTGKPTFYTASSCYIKGEKLEMPSGDTTLTAYVESENELSGETRLELNGAANTIHVASFNSEGKEVTKTINWPKNGLLYIKQEGACNWPKEGTSTEAYGADGTTEAENEKDCGDVYVKGSYSKALTIAAEDDLIINGNIYPTSVSTLGNEPTGTATLGLIAGNYVRVYHPVGSGTDTQNSCSAKNEDASEDPNKWGSQSGPWVYAAILSTDHSFIVDNFRCPSTLGELNVYGAIAQDYRGPVGTVGASGYTKDYKYDTRLAVDEPPYFLAPLKAGWHVIRETATAPG